MDFNKASVALLTASPNIVTLNVQVNAATHSAIGDRGHDRRRGQQQR